MMAGCSDGSHHSIGTGDRLSSRSSELIVPLSIKRRHARERIVTARGADLQG
jgi:hypothetical protein